MKKQVPKSKILKTALSLFSSNGYSETKMSVIARSAGLSVGALYLRFRNKEALFRELIRDQTKDFHKLMDELIRSNRDPLQTLRDFISINLELSFKKKQLISIFFREYKLPFLQPLRKHFLKTQLEIIENILRAGIKTKAFSPMDAKQTASIIFASIRGVVLLKLVFGIGDAKTQGSSLFNLITNGIKRDVS